MKKPTLSKNLIKVIAIAVIVISIILILDKCSREVTQESIAVPSKPQVTTKKQLNDSMLYVEQKVLLAETQKQLYELQSKLQRELFEKMNVKKAIASIQYVDRIVYTSIPGVRDTLQITNDSFPLKFVHDSKFLKEWYTVHSPEKSTIDSLKIIGKGYLAIGTAGKWYQKKTIKVGLVNENPYYIVDSIQSVVYKPKQRTQFSVGPILMGNKTSLSGGVGINLRKGIFSTTIGYKLF